MIVLGIKVTHEQWQWLNVNDLGIIVVVPCTTSTSSFVSIISELSHMFGQALASTRSVY